MYRFNIEASEYIKQMLTDIKEDIDSNTIIEGDFKTLLIPMDWTTTANINGYIKKENQ